MASTSPLTNKVTWHSSAIDIAQIDDKGILTGVSIGNADVKASYEGIESNIINVSITEAILTSITISAKSPSPDASIYSGGQLSFAAEGTYSDGSHIATDSIKLRGIQVLLILLKSMIKAY
ncbi:Ig-like domain-containing protein [Photobacterium leiognathi]|uniref:Ig-like domain-containing protein n=1 Tax=Photobacterium leiognathi TaxID=553611 RepID=UPI0027335B32|nr:Ig-like domain-containing protein [Photobacterium leiognathi]